jgi:hypothetical protein
MKKAEDKVYRKKSLLKSVQTTQFSPHLPKKRRKKKIEKNQHDENFIKDSSIILCKSRNQI